MEGTGPRLAIRSAWCFGAAGSLGIIAAVPSALGRPVPTMAVFGAAAFAAIGLAVLGASLTHHRTEADARRALRSQQRAFWGGSILPDDGCITDPWPTIGARGRDRPPPVGASAGSVPRPEA